MKARAAASPNRKLRLMIPITVLYAEYENQRDVILIIPGQPSDWINRLANQAIVKTGSGPPIASTNVQATAPAMPIR